MSACHIIMLQAAGSAAAQKAEERDVRQKTGSNRTLQKEPLLQKNLHKEPLLQTKMAAREQ